MIIGSGLLGAAAGIGGWGVLADARIVPGRSVIDDLLGRCDVTGPAPAEAVPGRLVRSSFYSQHRSQSVSYMLAYPPKVAAGAKLPVCLVLHGLGEDERAAFDGLNYHRLLAAATAAKVPPFVLASIEGGDGYWHPHEGGDDPLGMLLTDFPAVLQQHALPIDRFAVLGWSMGGYGALLAATEARDRIVAVAANAPAIFESYDDARAVNPTAFGSAAEWQSYGDLEPRLGKLPKALRIDCGESDSFEPAVARLGRYLPDPGALHIAPGCHDGTFWRSVAAQQLALIGNALTPPKTAG